MHSSLKGRLVSLDVFRGIAISLMILTYDLSGVTYFTAFQHADWHGWTFADLIFPFFIFIVGVAIPFSLGSRLARGENRKKLLVRVSRRLVILFVLGLIVNGFPVFDLSTIRVMGVLQRIGLCYFFASLVFLSFKERGQFVVAVLLSVFYWMLMTLVPVPGYGAGVLTREGNLAAYVDNLLLRGHLFTGAWDPEGLLSTIPAVATTLMGVLAGQHLRSDKGSMEKAVNLFFFGTLCVVVGFLWNSWFPINKNLWSSSFVAFTGGMALVFLAVCYYLIDVRKWGFWTKPFVIFGTNAIAVYVLSMLVGLTLIHVNVALADGSSVSLKNFVLENFFTSWAGHVNGVLLYAVAYLMLWLGIMAILYKKGIFIKV